MTPLASVIASRCQRVRAGLAVGFDTFDFEELRSVRGGVWEASGAEGGLPFDDRQFDVVAIDRKSVSRANILEVYRVLTPNGSMFFTVDERTGKQPGFTAPEIYKMVREGFDILELRRPKWWMFGRGGRTMTVCARKKTWREHKGLVRKGGVTLAPFRSIK